jgi:HD-GYP domain-containing protein (c-di-GMP phosphodiesterase class II)
VRETPQDRPAEHRVTVAEVLCAFAYANDLAFGLQLEDTLRSSYLAWRIAGELGVSGSERHDAYVTALLKDAGCTSWTTELASAWHGDEIAARRELLIFTPPGAMPPFVRWMREHVGRDEATFAKLRRYFAVLRTSGPLFREGFATTAAVATRIAERLGVSAGAQEALRSVFEQWDGSGYPNGQSGDSIPLVSRIVWPTFFLIPVHRVSGREAAVELAATMRGKAFDPAVADAFRRLAADEGFWAELESADIQAHVLALEPAAPTDGAGEALMDAASLAFADFIDLKSRHAAAHSRRVGAVSEQLARMMGCEAGAVAQIGRAGRMHDLGLVAVPTFILDRPAMSLSEAERDQHRLHPYHGERILRRVPAFAPLAEMVGTHHERADGSGYYRGLSGTNISLGARIIAVADRLDTLTHDRAGSEALPLEAALEAIGSEPFDREVVRALSDAVGSGPQGPRVDVPRAWPAGLTDREVEVLRLVARGLSRREVARRLGITENTARHHLEHIYNKIGSANRVGATLFAMEHGLLMD